MNETDGGGRVRERERKKRGREREPREGKEQFDGRDWDEKLVERAREVDPLLPKMSNRHKCCCGARGTYKLCITAEIVDAITKDALL